MKKEDITYGSIVPLIGGESLAIQNVLNDKHPEWVMSYRAFEENDSHYMNYIRNQGYEGDYVFLDEDKNYSPKQVDVVNTVCPCAGLSSLSTTSSASSATNDWLYHTSEYILEKVKPKVFWGENAPRLAMSTGAPVVAKLKEIAKKHGYTFSIYKTKSLVQGFSQVRDRTFYFYWKDNSVPLFDFIHRPHQKIEDLLNGVEHTPDDPMNQVLNKDIPSEFCLYEYILKEIHGGISHAEFVEQLPNSSNAFLYIENHSSYEKLMPWLKERGHDRWHATIGRMNEKLKTGKGVMRRTITWPKDYIGAFVGHLPLQLTHPTEDRYLTIRECMEIMYLPHDFQLLNEKKWNHICQNVPIKTAEDMMNQVVKHLQGKLDTVNTSYILQDNKRKLWEAETEHETASLEDFT
jgi:site-specific DNA-cytosine methylase